MKSLIYVEIIGISQNLLEVYERIKDYIYQPKKQECAYTGDGGNLRLYFEKDSVGLEKIFAICSEYNFQPFIAEDTVYTKKEIDSSEYFQMILSHPLEVEGTDASDYGTMYTGGCPHCTLGKELVGDVLIDRKFIKKCEFVSLVPDIIVSEPVMQLIESMKFSGIKFENRVQDYKHRDIREYRCVKIQTVLPPMHESTWLKVLYHGPQYKKCGHDVLYLRSDIKYDRQSLKHAKDFNFSYEYVNNDREHCIIVSNAVRKTFLQYKVRVGFRPVQIID